MIAHGLTSAAVRRTILDQAFRAKEGHIGSALSIADIVVAIYGGVRGDPAGPGLDHDVVILSKGHAVLAQYAALHALGRLGADDLATYGGDGSRYGVHPQHGVPGIDFTTGSLGQGLSLGVGVAIAARMQRTRRRVFVIVSDAECNEGSVWEASMLAAQRGLGNLIVVIDLNGQQALGETCAILDLGNMRERWAAFGWDARDADGHDVAGLAAMLADCDHRDPAPHVLVAHTVFGKGVSFMERQLRWHYASMTTDEYWRAVAELEGGPSEPRLPEP